MMRVRFSALALNDLEEIADYIGRDNTEAARRVVNGIEEACFSLGEFPELGVKSEVPRVRKLLVHGLPYKIIYETAKTKGVVVILRVYHDARDSRY
ncbi:MAG: type II toxin-antitoxin system RelE/ParE family toxin [bacterium]|nr:type II toxin-antitoxin system RelE/ParE family toxin [bacterium]